MIFDIVLTVVLIAGFYYGYQKGIVNTIFSILGFCIGILIITKFNEAMILYLGHHTQMNPAYLPILSILCLIIFIALFFKFLSWSSEQLLKSFHLTSINRIIGGSLFATLSLFLFSTLIWYVDNGSFINKETKEKSYTYAFVKPLSPLFTNAVGSAVPAFKGMYGNMNTAMDSVQSKYHSK